MLQNLHVKNLALIQEIEVDFSEGLNILTGETGAGKSIILGSIGLALGGKYSQDMLRTGADYGLVELCFSVEDQRIQKKLEAMDIYPDEGQIILTRKLTGGRSISRINGETVSMSVLKEVAGSLIDIYGQHEHQTLLNRKNHLTLLDLFGGEELLELKQEVAAKYKEYRAKVKKLEETSMDEKERKKEISLLEFEIQEIEEAELTAGEDELLEETYRRMSDGRKMTEMISEAYGYTSEGEGSNASDLLSRAIRALQEISTYDEIGAGLYEQLVEVDSLLNDFNRELADYQESFSFSQEEYAQTEDRLNEINRLKAKYGETISEIQDYYEEQCERLQMLQDYETYRNSLLEQTEKEKETLEESAERLSQKRKECAEVFEKKVEEGLRELNFLDVCFEVRLTRMEACTGNGWEQGEFWITLNPGEELRPLSKVASGGELSRVMLAIKSVMADKEETPTLIFDEIDTGISGITAAKVAKQMEIIGVSHQVICITHLPQIAAAADSHYLIEKSVENEKTRTQIRKLDEEGSVMELARILGGDQITETILSSAKEMKQKKK